MEINVNHLVSRGRNRHCFFHHCKVVYEDRVVGVIGPIDCCDLAAQHMKDIVKIEFAVRTKLVQHISPLLIFVVLCYMFTKSVPEKLVEGLCEPRCCTL